MCIAHVVGGFYYTLFFPHTKWSKSIAESVKNYGVEASMVMQWTVNPPLSSTPGSIPGYSTKICALSSVG